MSLSMHVIHQEDNTKIFAVTKQIPSHNVSVQKMYSTSSIFNWPMSCSYNLTKITLSVKPNESHGWKVELSKPGYIKLKDIQEYKEGKIPPKIELSRRWISEGKQEEERLEVLLEMDSRSPIFPFDKHSPFIESESSSYRFTRRASESPSSISSFSISIKKFISAISSKSPPKTLTS